MVGNLCGYPSINPCGGGFGGGLIAGHGFSNCSNDRDTYGMLSQLRLCLYVCLYVCTNAMMYDIYLLMSYIP